MHNNYFGIETQILEVLHNLEMPKNLLINLKAIVHLMPKTFLYLF
jgi:hypothetical protein